MRRKLFLNNKGNIAVLVPVLVIVLCIIGVSTFEYSRLNIIAQGSRDAVQAAITQVCTENYDQLYNGLREGYSGGYKLESMSWIEDVNPVSITTKLDSKLGTHNGEKTTGGKTEYRISNLSVNIKNALLAPMDTDNVQQFTGSATYTLTVPLSFGWQSLPPMVIPMEVTAGYAPKGELSGDSDGNVPTSGIKLSESDLTLGKGEFASLSADVLPEDATNPNISWVSSDNNIVTVNQSGLVEGINIGSTKVLAISDGRMAQCDVRVVSPITDIKLNKHQLALHKSFNETLIATVTPPDATDKSLWWTTSDPNICTVDANGKVTGISNGTAEVIVQSKGSGVMDRCTVVVDSPVTGISLNKNALTLIKGTNETLIATVYPEDASKKGVLWATSNPDICTVQTGNVKAVDSGKAIVTATTMDGKFVAQCTVTVIIPVTGVSLNKSSLTLVRESSETLVATIWPANATDKAVSWSSSNSAVAQVDQNGTVTAISKGTAIITVTTHDGGIKASCTVTVTPKQFTVTAFASPGGYVTGGGTYDEGSNVQLNAYPDEHYHFVNWVSHGTVISRKPTYTIYGLSSDFFIQANFDINLYTLTVNAEAGGTATGGGTYPYGSVVTISAKPNEGYDFAGWSDGNTNATRSYTVTQDTTLTAKFKQILVPPNAPANISVSCDSSGTITMSWPASTQGTSSKQFRYNIYIDGAMVGSTTNTSHSFAYSGGRSYTLKTEYDKDDKYDQYTYQHSGTKRTYTLGVQGQNELGISSITSVSRVVGKQKDTTINKKSIGAIIYIVKLTESCEYSKGTRPVGYDASCYGDDFYDLNDAKNWKDYCRSAIGDYGVFCYNGDINNPDYGYRMVGKVTGVSRKKMDFTTKDEYEYYFVE